MPAEPVTPPPALVPPAPGDPGDPPPQDAAHKPVAATQTDNSRLVAFVINIYCSVGVDQVTHFVRSVLYEFFMMFVFAFGMAARNLSTNACTSAV